jgi:hypothetical protein
LEGRPRAARGAVLASAALAIAALWLVVPRTCVSKPVAIAGLESIHVDRCRFRWTDPQRPPGEPDL